MKNKKILAIIFAMLASLLYAINMPFSKILLNNISPTMLASYLYLGAGIGVGIMYLFSNKEKKIKMRKYKNTILYM